MSRVFVTQENNLNFRQAEEFGELAFLYDKRDDFHNIANSEHNAHLLAHLRQGLRDFDENEDWLVITGSPYVNAAIFWILGQKRIRKIRLLRWDNRDFSYIPLTLTLETIDL